MGKCVMWCHIEIRIFCESKVRRSCSKSDDPVQNRRILSKNGPSYRKLMCFILCELNCNCARKQIKTHFLLKSVENFAMST